MRPRHPSDVIFIALLALVAAVIALTVLGSLRRLL
jgi:hypothetical protein